LVRAEIPIKLEEEEEEESRNNINIVTKVTMLR
jgi:hypothetical protein